MKAEIANITVADAVLVERYQRGDYEAMEVLILKYQNRIYNLILKMCANADDASELSQETFVKAIDNLDKFEGRSAFYTWLFRIAVNLTINYCQKHTEHGFVSLDSECNEDNNQANVTLKKFLCDQNSPDPAIVAQNKELCQIIVKLLMELNAGQRAVILLRDIEGMNYAVIAKVLNIKPGTVKSRISRARNNLREMLDVLFFNNTDRDSKYLSVVK
ncbi:MAG: RNA polymerase sigma factor [Planctomycetota bacterium]|jgi:RNA polymerase sigma-70 factor (ECF subfamily)